MSNAIYRDFFDNTSIRQSRFSLAGVRLNVRPTAQFVEQPVDYSDKINQAREFLRSKGITDIKSIRRCL
jgi:hypothetical protein